MNNGIKLSENFKWKLKNLQGKININVSFEPIEYLCSNFIKTSVPGPLRVYVKVDLSDHSNSNYDLKECEKWINLTYDISLLKEQYSIDIGPFEGLFPTKIDGSIIELNADNFNPKPSWKDWFIMEGDEYFK